MICALIILAILEFLFTVTFVILTFKRKIFLDKKNLMYFIPVLMINVLNYVIGNYFSNDSISFNAFFDCLGNAVKNFALSPKIELVQPLLTTNVAFAIIFLYGFIMAGLCTFSTIVGAFQISIFNSFRLQKLYGKKNIDLVIGYSKDSLNYIKNEKNIILFVDSTTHRLQKEEIKDLYIRGITFINKPLNPTNINHVLKRMNGDTFVICFGDNTEYLKIFSLVENTKTENKSVFYRIQSNSKYKYFLNEQLSKKINRQSKVMADSFDVYSLIGLDFNRKYNLAQFININDFEKGALKNNVEINCYFLGFGSTNTELFKSLIINNQFIKANNGKASPYPVNYKIYEKDSAKTEVSYIKFLKEFDTILPETNLPKPDRICNLEIINKNILGDGLIELNKSINHKDGVYNFFFVALTNSFDNCAIASQLAALSEKNTVVFYKVNAETDVTINNSRIIPFGFKHNIINHYSICNDDDYIMSAASNAIYQANNNTNTNFMSLNITEKLSNVYQQLNLKFKANSLGYDISRSKEGEIVQDKFDKAIESANIKKYDDYFKNYTINNLIAQEHQRWNAYYLLNGFLPMKLDDVIYDAKEKKTVHKNIEKKLHACITTIEGLDILHKHEEQLYIDNNNKKTIGEIETYKFDMEIVKELKQNLNKHGYYLVKRG